MKKNWKEEQKNLVYWAVTIKVQSLLLYKYFSQTKTKNYNRNLEKRLKRNPKLDPKIRSEIPSSAASRVLFIGEIGSRFLIELTRNRQVNRQKKIMETRQSAFSRQYRGVWDSVLVCGFIWSDHLMLYS